METDDGLGVPDFLRVTPEEAARRKQWWIDNPPKPYPAFNDRRTEVAPSDLAAIAEIEASQAERKRLKDASRIAKMKTRLESKGTKGKRWDTQRGRWVTDAPRPMEINATRRRQMEERA